jgi:hypothetical protein
MLGNSDCRENRSEADAEELTWGSESGLFTLGIGFTAK